MVNTTQSVTIHRSDIKGGNRETEKDLTAKNRQNQTDESGELDVTDLFLSDKLNFYRPLRSKSLNAYPWRARSFCNSMGRSCQTANSEHDLPVACEGISNQQSDIGSKKKREKVKESLFNN